MTLDQWLTTLALQLRTWAGEKQRAAWIYRERKARDLGGYGEQVESLGALDQPGKEMLVWETSPGVGAVWELGFLWGKWRGVSF